MGAGFRHGLTGGEGVEDPDVGLMCARHIRCESRDLTHCTFPQGPAQHSLVTD